MSSALICQLRLVKNSGRNFDQSIKFRWASTVARAGRRAIRQAQDRCTAARSLKAFLRSLSTIHAGEKATDAAAALGLVATTNAGGELAIGKTDWSPVLRFSTVAIVTDNDDAGEKFGQMLAARLLALKADLVVKLVRVSKEPKGDVVEAIRDGLTEELFFALVEVRRLSAWKRPRRGEIRVKRTPAQSGRLSNAIIEVEGDGDEKKTIVRPRPMAEIIADVSRPNGRRIAPRGKSALRTLARQAHRLD